MICYQMKAELYFVLQSKKRYKSHLIRYFVGMSSGDFVNGSSILLFFSDSLPYAT